MPTKQIEKVATATKIVGKKKVRKKIFRLQAAVEVGKAAQLGEWGEYWKARKKPVTMYLDADVLAWFRREGPGYQTRINQALREIMVKEVRKLR
jgi:uncharacterized protein (DUF4415 family)